MKRGKAEVDNPIVVVNELMETAIRLFREVKHTFFVHYDGSKGIRISKQNPERFERTYKPLYVYVNGVPDEQKPYNPQDAARRYLSWGNYAGITEVAYRALQNILIGAKMSTTESDVSNQQESRVPTTEALGEALDKASKPEKAKKASTKNGTTAKSKRPSKAVAVAIEPAKPQQPKKEKDMATKATKSKTSTKKATKPAKTIAKKAGPKSNAKKANGAAKPARKARSSFDTDKKIKVLVDGNPRREGSKGYDNWSKIKRYDGKSVSAYLESGGRPDNLRTDINRGHVKLV